MHLLPLHLPLHSHTHRVCVRSHLPRQNVPILPHSFPTSPLKTLRLVCPSTKICELCGLTIPSKHLRRHFFLRHHGKGSFPCPLCSIDFHRSYHLFTSVVCSKLFTNPPTYSPPSSAPNSSQILPPIHLRRLLQTPHKLNGPPLPRLLQPFIQRPQMRHLWNHLRPLDKWFQRQHKIHEDHYHTKLGRYRQEQNLTQNYKSHGEKGKKRDYAVGRRGEGKSG
jgi:hypothetical protein